MKTRHVAHPEMKVSKQTSLGVRGSEWAEGGLQTLECKGRVFSLHGVVCGATSVMCVSLLCEGKVGGPTVWQLGDIFPMKLT